MPVSTSTPPKKRQRYKSWEENKEWAGVVYTQVLSIPVGCLRPLGSILETVVREMRMNPHTHDWIQVRIDGSPLRWRANLAKMFMNMMLDRGLGRLEERAGVLYVGRVLAGIDPVVRN